MLVYQRVNLTSEHLCGRLQCQVQSSSVDSFSDHLAKVQSQSRQHIAELILGANGENPDFY